VGRKRIFEQACPAMPISDYASAFFFARRSRVTLQRCSMLQRRCACYFKSASDRPLTAISSWRSSASSVRIAEWASVEIRCIRNPRAASAEQCHPAKQYAPENRLGKKGLENRTGSEIRNKKARQIKKPGCAGLVDEWLCRSAHFASLAI